MEDYLFSNVKLETTTPMHYRDELFQVPTFSSTSPSASTSLYDTADFVNILPLFDYDLLRQADEILFEYKDICENPSNVEACSSYEENPLLSPASAAHQKVTAAGRFDRLSPYHHKTPQPLNDESCIPVVGYEVREHIIFFMSFIFLFFSCLQKNEYNVTSILELLVSCCCFSEDVY